MFTDSLIIESFFLLLVGVGGMISLTISDNYNSKIPGIIMISTSIVLLFMVHIIQINNNLQSEFYKRKPIKPGDVLIFDYRATSQDEVDPFKGDTIEILKVSNNHALFKTDFDETLDSIDELSEDSTSIKEEHFTSCPISELSNCSIHIKK